MKSFIQFLLLLLLTLSGTQAIAQTQVVDLSTGIYPNNTTTQIPQGPASWDDTWTVAYGSPVSFQPVTCGGLNYPPGSSFNVNWVTSYYYSWGPGGDYYFKMIFNREVCNVDSAILEFITIGADDAIDMITVNTTPHPVYFYLNGGWGSNVSIPVAPSELVPGQNEILVHVFNWSSADIPATPVGMQIDGKLKIWGTPNTSPAFSLTSSGGNVQASSTVSGTHSWIVYSSQTGNQGSYTYVNTYNTATLNFQATAPCYLIQHTITDSCGSSCTAQSICNLPCHSQCDISVPKNLQFAYNGMSWPPQPNAPYLFSWDPVSGAASYVLEIVWNDPTCCSNGGEGFYKTNIPVTNNSYQMDMSMQCFSWRVRAVCADGSSVVSQKKCENSGTGGGDPQNKSAVGNVSNENTLLNIFPNPAKESVSFDIESAADATFTITVTDIDGKIVKTFESVKTVGKKASIKWNTAALSKGIYMVKITTTDNHVTTKKLVIE